MNIAAILVGCILIGGVIWLIRHADEIMPFGDDE